MRRLLATAAAVTIAAFAAAPAQGATTLVVTGAGFGHGVGLSQYGTLGYAQRGWTAPRILAHYYTGTALSRLSSSPTVRVLLATGKGSYDVRGAVSAGGRRLDPRRTWRVTRGGQGLLLRDTAGGRTAFTSSGPLALSAPSGGSVQLGGAAYRGALEFRADGSGLMAVNAVGLEDYVAGVVSAESPASWPAEALRAQAIAARTYAITTNAGGTGGAFTQYADTRSQVYRGVAAETPSTNAAVRATSRQVVTYQGRPVTTFFFSTSGGRTENVENSFLGATPKPWLKSVADPYDTTSPYHRWPVTRLSLARASRLLGSSVKGTLREIRVTRRGVSPRVVRAQVIGTGGTTEVTGPQLRRLLGLRDTWVRFRLIATTTGRSAPAAPATPTPPISSELPGALPSPSGPTVDPGTGGARTSRLRVRTIRGRIAPAAPGSWATVERRTPDGWTHVLDALLGRGGRYEERLPEAGTYRVRYAGAAGPAVIAR